MNVSAPIVMIGAVSPIARDMPMMTPVRMPGIEYGHDVILDGLPLRRADRIRALADHRRECERIASRVATITIGRISSASVSPAVWMLWPRPNA